MINPHCTHKFSLTLNESPSEKEGKSSLHRAGRAGVHPSMKVPPKRKGNLPRPFSALSNPHPQ